MTKPAELSTLRAGRIGYTLGFFQWTTSNSQDASYIYLPLVVYLFMPLDEGSIMGHRNSLKSRTKQMTSFGTERALEKSVPPLEGASAFPASGALPQSASAAVEPPKEEAAQKIISALENPRYIWRTIGGISRETNIDPSVVAQILGQLPAEIIIESSMPDEEGRRLFTTRRHYKTKRGTINRIISAVSDVVK